MIYHGLHSNTNICTILTAVLNDPITCPSQEQDQLHQGHVILGWPWSFSSVVKMGRRAYIGITQAKFLCFTLTVTDMNLKVAIQEKSTHDQKGGIVYGQTLDARVMHFSRKLHC